jgi:hypothetical protein
MRVAEGPLGHGDFYLTLSLAVGVTPDEFVKRQDDFFVTWW